MALWAGGGLDLHQEWRVCDIPNVGIRFAQFLGVPWRNLLQKEKKVASAPTETREQIAAPMHTLRRGPKAPPNAYSPPPSPWT
jgi:hypothetical protein